LMDKILEEEFDLCFEKQCPASKDNLKKIVSEFIKK